MTKKIAIIGANGQVGSEVCLFLREFDGVEPIAISRTDVGAAFLRACGVTPRIGDISKPEDASRLLADADLIADFSLPGGSSVEVRNAITGIVTSATANAPRGVPYAYLSSITAFGIPHFRGDLKYYRLSRNQYGASKRHGEALVAERCKAEGRDSYVLRVGVVHGELQAVSRQTERDVRAAAGVVTHVPDAPSFTVFAFSIAEAVAGIALGKERPGLYTLVSSPAWSWLDLHDYFVTRAGVESRVVLMADDEEDSGGGLGLTSAAWRMVASQKDLVGAYLATAVPKVELRLRARYQEKNTAGEVSASDGDVRYRPYGNNHAEFPGPRLASLSDSRVTMETYAARVRAAVAGALANALDGAS
ncbi:MAG: NAD-dependent epimerase/dehydratase family protein [Acidimicrobiia bacterium]